MMEIQMLGTRGSVPVSGDEFRIYGHATSCVRIKTETAEIYLDAGTGIEPAACEEGKRIVLLLSHLHLDHLLGLMFFDGLLQTKVPVEIYAKSREGKSAREHLRTVFTPPFWPIGVEDLPAEVIFNEAPDEFSIDDVKIELLEGNHPGGVSLFRITQDEQTLVFVSDYEWGSSRDEKLIAFAKDADLLIFDGQYTSEEAKKCRGYGHSTAEDGLFLAERSGAKKLVITHHSPYHKDEQLKKMEEAFSDAPLPVIFAKQNESYTLA